MKKYQVNLKFDSTFSVLVEAETDQEAMNKARDMAENADANEFIRGIETDVTLNCLGV